MRPCCFVATVMACAGALAAQTPSTPPVQTQNSGLETDWEMAGVLREISAQAGRLAPVLDRIDARSWIDQGASETYNEQLQAVKEQARALTDGASAVAKNPERVSAELEILFRMQAIDAMLQSVEEGIRKYGSKPDAQTLVSLQAASGANRERLQRYVVSLAAEREQEFEAMDREAQRCRAVVTAPKAVKKK